MSLVSRGIMGKQVQEDNGCNLGQSSGGCIYQYTLVECRWMGKDIHIHSSLGDCVGEIGAGGNSYTISKSA